MRAARWIIGVVAALLLLAIAVILTVTLLVDPNRFKGRIEAMVQSATGRPFEIHGDLDIAWYPWLAVRIGPAQLGNPTGMEGEPLVQWRSARVGARLIPLIRGHLIISRVRLEGLQAQLHRGADGRANWEDLWTGREGSKEGRRAPEFAGMEIRDGVVEYVDERSDTRLRISDWELDVGEWKSAEPVSVRTRFVLREGPVPAAQVPIELEIARAFIQRSPLSVAIPRFVLRIANAELDGSIAVENTAPLRANGVLSIEISSLRKLLAELALDVPRPRDESTLEKLKMTSRWVARDRGIVVRPIEIELDRTKLVGELARSGAAAPVWTFNLHGDRIDLGRYTDLEDTDSKPFELPTAALKALRVQGVLSFDEAELAAAKMRDVRLRVELEEGELRNATTTRSQAAP